MTKLCRTCSNVRSESTGGGGGGGASGSASGSAKATSASMTTRLCSLNLPLDRAALLM